MLGVGGGGEDFNQRGVSDEKKGVVLIGDVWEGRGGWVSKKQGRRNAASRAHGTRYTEI